MLAVLVVPGRWWCCTADALVQLAQLAPRLQLLPARCGDVVRGVPETVS